MVLHRQKKSYLLFHTGVEADASNLCVYIHQLMNAIKYLPCLWQKLWLTIYLQGAFNCPIRQHQWQCATRGWKFRTVFSHSPSTFSVNIYVVCTEWATKFLVQQRIHSRQMATFVKHFLNMIIKPGAVRSFDSTYLRKHWNAVCSKRTG